MVSLYKAAPQSLELIPSFLWEEGWFLLERGESTSDKIHSSEVFASGILYPVALVKEDLKTNLGCLLDFFVIYFGALCFCVWKKKRNLIWILCVASFDWAFSGCGGVFIDLQVNNKTWSFSIHHVPNASLSFHELRNYFFKQSIWKELTP